MTLLKSVLGSIPTFFMLIYKVLVGVLKHLESLRSNFFLRANMDEKKMSWVSWNKVCSQKKHGGLGVSSFF